MYMHACSSRYFNPQFLPYENDLAKRHSWLARAKPELQEKNRVKSSSFTLSIAIANENIRKCFLIIHEMLSLCMHATFQVRGTSLENNTKTLVDECLQPKQNIVKGVFSTSSSMFLACFQVEHEAFWSVRSANGLHRFKNYFQIINLALLLQNVRLWYLAFKNKKKSFKGELVILNNFQGLVKAFFKKELRTKNAYTTELATLHCIRLRPLSGRIWEKETFIRRQLNETCFLWHRTSRNSVRTRKLFNLDNNANETKLVP